MALVPINWRPDRKTLKEFSEAWMVALGMVLTPLALVRGQGRLALVLWSLAVVGRVAGLVRPTLLRPVFLALTLATWPIGWVVSHLALGLIYYGLFTPIALAFRLTGRDALKRTFDRDAPTYWEPYDLDRRPERYLKQF